MMERLEVVYKRIDELHPYPNNPRVNDHAVSAVAESIRTYGFRVPIIVDEHGEIIAGHTRWKAARQLGLEEVPVIVVRGWPEEKKRAYRIADNKLAEIADWDYERLMREILEVYEADADLAATMGFSDDELQALVDEALKRLEAEEEEASGEAEEEEEGENPYTWRVESPLYYPSMPHPPRLEDIVDTSRYDELVREIEQADIPEEARRLLLLAATRHIVIDYRYAAEYYAHAPEPVRRLMERSALVIPDWDRAIEYGYVQMLRELRALVSEEDEYYEEAGR